MMHPDVLALSDDEMAALGDVDTRVALDRFAADWDAHALLLRSIARAYALGQTGTSQFVRDLHIRRAFTVYIALQDDQRQTLRELRDRCKLHSTATVAHLLDTLERAGLIVRRPRQARSIALRTIS